MDIEGLGGEIMQHSVDSRRMWTTRTSYDQTMVGV